MFRPWALDDIEGSLAAAFERHVARAPERVAVRSCSGALAYHELDARANRLAHALLTRGQRGGRVALLLDHDVASIVALLATWKAGMGAVPLDVAHPAQRLAGIVAHAACRIVVTENRRAELAAQLRLPAAVAPGVLVNLDALDPTLSEKAPALDIAGTDLAFILFTSGSTGAPKGVMQAHRNSLRGIIGYTNATRITADDRVVVIGSCAGGHAMQTTVFALTNGATVLPFDIRAEGIDRLAAFLESERVTILFASATVFRHLTRALEPGKILATVRFVQLSTEPVHAGDVAAFRRHFAQGCEFFNAYGSTETANIALHRVEPDARFRDGETVPVGQPVEGVVVSLLDESGRDVRDGEVGEIVVRGRYLSLGYWRDEKQTAAAFRDAGDGSGDRLYFTGDVGRRNADGAFVHLGRKDFQVKVRGFRIELEEIEAALRAHASVAIAAVSARPDAHGDDQLVAHLVLAHDGAFVLEKLQEHLRARLAPQLVPSAFLEVFALPKTPGGKIDRRALASLDGTLLAGSSTFAVPRNSTEETLAEIWRRVLARERVGVTENFFDLGGHSLLAMQLVREIGERFSRSIPLATLFAAPTIESLARRLAKAESGVATFAAPQLRGHGPGAPLFHIPGLGGYEFLPTTAVERLSGERPSFDGLQFRGMDGREKPRDRVEDIAADLIEQVRAVRPQGPYCFTGYCFGGLVAFEIARQLAGGGERVSNVVLWDAFPTPRWRRRSVLEILVASVHQLRRGGAEGRAGFFLSRLKWRLRRTRERAASSRDSTPPTENDLPDWALAAAVGPAKEVVLAAVRANRSYHPQPYDGRISILRTRRERLLFERLPLDGWSGIARGPVEFHDLPCDHFELLREPMIGLLAEKTALSLRSSEN